MKFQPVLRSRDKTDYDVIRENHKFLWDQEKDIPDTWGAKLAKKYYDKLFKEYCICNLTYYKHNKVYMYNNNKHNNVYMTYSILYLILLFYTYKFVF